MKLGPKPKRVLGCYAQVGLPRVAAGLYPNFGCSITEGQKLGIDFIFLINTNSSKIIDDGPLSVETSRPSTHQLVIKYKTTAEKQK